MRRMRTMVVAGLLTVAALWSALPTPASAVDLSGSAVYWKLNKHGVRGLVVVVENPDVTRVAFHLTGLKHHRAYKLQGFSAGCGQPGTRLFSRSGTSTAKGYWWDPAPIAPAADGLVSVRVRDVAAGKVVACANQPAGTLDPQVAAVKLKATGGLRGLVVVDGRSGTRVVGSFSGLVPNAGYLIHGAAGSCTQIALLTLTMGLTTTAKGLGRIDEMAAPVTAGVIETESIGINKAGSSNAACGNVFNAA